MGLKNRDKRTPPTLPTAAPLTINHPWPPLLQLGAVAQAAQSVQAAAGASELMGLHRRQATFVRQQHRESVPQLLMAETLQVVVQRRICVPTSTRCQ